MSNFKLGRNPSDPSKLAKVLKLKDYLKKDISTPPEFVSRVTKVPNWPMYLNDELGDCVEAAAAHMVQQWTLFGNPPGVQVSDNDVLVSYENVGGYRPGNPSTDNGSSMINFLEYWKTVGLGGHKILGYVFIEPKNNLDQIKWAMEYFGNVFLGVNLPISVQGQTSWTVANGGVPAGGNNAAGSWGGHCVPLVAYSPITLTCVSWGSPLKMSYNFFHDYAEEAYAVLSQDWLNTKTQLDPDGLNYTQLMTDLSSL